RGISGRAVPVRRRHHAMGCARADVSAADGRRVPAVLAGRVTVDLERFTRAQDGAGGITQAIAELDAGAKRSHWIWYIFPQLAGLGSSPMAEMYGLRGADEAAAYLRHPVLRERLLSAMNAVRRQSVPLRTLMGSHIDALKLVSSM